MNAVTGPGIFRIKPLPAVLAIAMAEIGLRMLADRSAKIVH